MTPLTRLLAVLGLLYVSQGLPFGFLVKALPAVAREQGMATAYIGLLALPAAPWALKFLWAPWVDRLGAGRAGHRKRWLVSMQASAVVVLVLLALLDPGRLFDSHFVVFLLLLTLLNALFATHDVASDGLAVRLLPVSLRGIGNSIQSGGYKAGMIVGSAIMLLALDHLGWQNALLLMATWLLLVLWPVVRYPEPPEPADQLPVRERGWWWRSFTGFWWRPGLLTWLAVLVLYKIGDSFGSRMIKPMLVDMEWSLSAIGTLDLFSSMAGLLGAAVGGGLMLLLPRVTALILFACFQALGLWGWSQLDGNSSVQMVWLVSLVEQFSDGLATVALFTMMMDRCRPGHEGSDYTQQASLLLGSSGLFTLGSGFSAEALGYSGHFLVSAVLSLMAIIPALRLRSWRANVPVR